MQTNFWNDGTELYHYGVKGQRWGERRYQNPDGSLTEEGRRHYGVGSSVRTFGERGYVSRASRNPNYSEKNRVANQEYDKKITQYYDKTSGGKAVLKKMLMGPAGEMTYNMARAAGEGRFKSYLRNIFDLNGGRILGSIAGAEVANLIGGQALKSVAKSIISRGEDYDTKDLVKDLGKTALGIVGGSIAGGVVNKAIQRRSVKSGRELSIQQQLLRRKATSNRR